MSRLTGNPYPYGSPGRGDHDLTIPLAHPTAPSAPPANPLLLQSRAQSLSQPSHKPPTQQAPLQAAASAAAPALQGPAPAAGVVKAEADREAASGLRLVDYTSDDEEGGTHSPTHTGQASLGSHRSRSLQAGQSTGSTPGGYNTMPSASLRRSHLGLKALHASEADSAVRHAAAREAAPAAASDEALEPGPPGVGSPSVSISATSRSTLEHALANASASVMRLQQAAAANAAASLGTHPMHEYGTAAARNLQAPTASLQTPTPDLPRIADPQRMAEATTHPLYPRVGDLSRNSQPPRQAQQIGTNPLAHPLVPAQASTQPPASQPLQQSTAAQAGAPILQAAHPLGSEPTLNPLQQNPPSNPTPTADFPPKLESHPRQAETHGEIIISAVPGSGDGTADAPVPTPTLGNFSDSAGDPSSIMHREGVDATGVVEGQNARSNPQPPGEGTMPNGQGIDRRGGELNPESADAAALQVGAMGVTGDLAKLGPLGVRNPEQALASAKAAALQVGGPRGSARSGGGST